MTLCYCAEPGFDASPWFREILFGLRDEARQKRLRLIKMDAVSQLAECPPGETVFALLIGSTFSWMNAALADCRAYPVRPVLLSNQQQNSFSGEYGLVSVDLRQSMAIIGECLHGLGCTKPALYGVNPESLSDLSREEYFVSHGGKPQDVFENHGSLAACFSLFEPVYAEYDAVVCVNAYAAVSLLTGLKKRGAARMPKLVSCSDMALARFFSPGITSFSARFGDFGKAAVAICELQQRNPSMTSVHILLDGELRFRETAGEPARLCTSAWPAQPEKASRFYQDPETLWLLRLETLLNSCDGLDFRILAGLMGGATQPALCDETYLSPTGLKYRVRRMMNICDVQKKSELLDLLRGVLSKEALLKESGNQSRE